MDEDYIKIRFKQPGVGSRSCIRMVISKDQKDTMVIERVRPLEKQFSMACYLYLAFLLCTFIRVHVIEIMDTLDQSRDNYTNNAYQNYRRSKYTEFVKQGIPSKYTNNYLYPHDLSYFSDYGFVDHNTIEVKPVFSNCVPSNSPFCETNDSSLSENIVEDEKQKITFILMKREVITSRDYFKDLNEKLNRIALSGLTAEQLCTKLPCISSAFELPSECTSDGFFSTIVNEFKPDTQGTPKFGYVSFNTFPYTTKF
jgi:hypothetical protein